MGGNPFFSVSSGYPTTNFGYDKNKKQLFINRLYIVKDSAFDELENAIRIVVDGKTYMNPQVANLVIESLVSQSAPSGRQSFSLLTERAREVLQLISEGRSTKQVAADLNVSAKTVESHRRQVMGKLNIRNVAELTKYAIREGLTSV